MDLKRSCKWVWCFGRRLFLCEDMLCACVVHKFPPPPSFLTVLRGLWGRAGVSLSGGSGFGDSAGWSGRVLSVCCFVRLWSLIYFLSILQRPNGVCLRNWHRCIFQLLVLSTKNWLEKPLEVESPDPLCSLDSICLLFHGGDNAKIQIWYKLTKRIVIPLPGVSLCLLYSLICFTVIHALENLCDWV